MSREPEPNALVTFLIIFLPCLLVILIGTLL